MKQIIFTAIFILVFCFEAFAQIDDEKNLKFPQTLLDKKVKDLNGKIFQISDSKTKFKFVLFWNSFSPPAIIAFDELNKKRIELQKKDVEVFGLIPESKYLNSNRKIKINTEAIEQDKKAAIRFNRKFKVKFQSGFLEDEKILDELKVNVVPQIWILTSDGNVFKKFIGYTLNETFDLLIKTIDDISKK